MNELQEKEIQKDKNLLEQVLMKLAFTEDNQLEKQISILLIPIIMKLSSPQENIQKKVKYRYTIIFYI